MTPVQDRTRALVAPASASVDEAARADLRGGLVDRLGPLVAPLAANDPVVISLPVLRQSRVRPESLGAREEPFSWRPAFVRRSLGLAVVEACALGRFPTPLDAVAPVTADAVSRWEQTGWRSFHWEPWMAGLAPGARAVVMAEAVGWASALWSWLDWSLVDRRLHFGGADDQWTCPAIRTVRLRGRAELRVPLTDPGTGTATEGPAPMALVSVSGGCPSDSWRDELAYLALVASLRSPSRPVPARVLGRWPDAGADRTVEVDDRALAEAGDRVVECVTAVVEARRSVSA
jgi:hypothetical protein